MAHLSTSFLLTILWWISLALLNMVFLKSILYGKGYYIVFAVSFTN